MLGAGDGKEKRINAMKLSKYERDTIILTNGKLLVIENLKMKKMLGHHLAVSFPQMVRHHYIIKEI